jgi:glycosyltransferase involved in cell wall biosynthesis
VDKISVIIPVKNEEETIGSVIKATIDFAMKRDDFRDAVNVYLEESR